MASERVGLTGRFPERSSLKGKLKLIGKVCIVRGRGRWATGLLGGWVALQKAKGLR